MGMLEDLAGNVLGGGMGNQGGGNSIIPLILQLISSQPGGIAGLLSKFQQNGLGDVASSWVGTGQNMPISPNQLQGVLGDDAMSQLASRLGIAPEAASSQLAGIFPGVIDQLTPGGELRQDDAMSQITDLLKGFSG